LAQTNKLKNPVSEVRLCTSADLCVQHYRYTGIFTFQSFKQTREGSDQGFGNILGLELTSFIVETKDFCCFHFKIASLEERKTTKV
jgi:hypothetical protein